MEERKSCWPWALLGLLGLGLLWALSSFWGNASANGLRANAKSAAQEALDASGYQGFAAEVDGAFMVVKGEAASVEAREMACNAVRQSLIAKSMLGLPGVVMDVRCAITVPGEPVVAGTPAAPVAQAKPAPAADGAACGERLATVARSGAIQFELQRAEIKSGQAVLDQIADIAKQCSAHSIEVGGHTDARGGDAINVPLSQARAEEVRRYLVAKGVPGERLSAKGYGSSKPLMPGADVPANRRTEFVITQK
jgi:outer membrane protein OmpA-like peptidoglycan-associated protein